jgi:CrcB protein
MDLKAILAVGIGGGIGAILRYLVGAVFLQRFGPGFPWGTFFINVTGSFLIGVVAQLALTRAFGMTPTVRLFAATGVLGGYTTFSTFSLDTFTLVQDGAAPLALAYALGSVVAGFFGAYAGQVVARLGGT